MWEILFGVIIFFFLTWAERIMTVGVDSLIAATMFIFNQGWDCYGWLKIMLGSLVKIGGA